MPAKLTLYPAQGVSRSFVFHEGKNHFAGRDPGSDIVLTDSRVSARHALFQWTGGNWVLVDLRSKNGTFVNSVRVTEVPLQSGDWLSFGGLLARYERASEAEVASLESERAARLQSFVEARRDLDANLEAATLLRRLLESALQLAGADRGFLLLVGPDGELAAEVASGFAPFEPLDERFTGSFAAIEKVLRTSQPVVASGVRASDAASRKRRTLTEIGVGALACVPLRAAEKVAGLLYVNGRKRGGVFTDVDLEVLEALADHAALLAGSLRCETPVRELIGAPSLSNPPGSRSFLDDLEQRVGEIARGTRKRPGRLTPRV